jgi:hypothetical protein
MAQFDDAVTDPAVRRAELERFVDEPANEGRLVPGAVRRQPHLRQPGPADAHRAGPPMLELLFGVQMSRGNARRATRSRPPGVLGPGPAGGRDAEARVLPVGLDLPVHAGRRAALPEVLRLSQTDADVVERLNAFRPTVLTAYAGVLETLALEALAGRLRLAPQLQQVVNNSEVLTARARARVERAFGLRVMDNYATGECPILSNGCPTDLGAHVNADWAILEVGRRAVPPRARRDGPAGRS